MNAGVSVLMVEYRGYGRSEGEPSEEGIYRDAGGCLAMVGDNARSLT